MKRFNVYAQFGRPVPSEHEQGDWVRYTDHVAALDQLRSAATLCRQVLADDMSSADEWKAAFVAVCAALEASGDAT